jgi:hypothetical protein
VPRGLYRFTRISAISIGVLVGCALFLNALAALPALSSFLDFFNVCVMGLSLLPLTIFGIRKPQEAALALIGCVFGGMIGYAMLVGPGHMFVGSAGFAKFCMLFPIPYLTVAILFLLSCRVGADSV